MNFFTILSLFNIIVIMDDLTFGRELFWGSVVINWSRFHKKIVRVFKLVGGI